MPELLTIDNGREFAAIPDLADILQLVAQIRSMDGRKAIVHAQPYNARARVVENVIGVLQRCWFAGVPGHVGNNRINRKTQQVGRPTKPFPGSFALFCDVMQVRVREYNNDTQRSMLKGRSPERGLSVPHRCGIEITKVDCASLQLAFSTRDEREVGKFATWLMAGGGPAPPCITGRGKRSAF